MRLPMLVALAAALASPCPVGCSFLETRSQGASSPCGCGTGLVRRVKTREELEKLSQPDLDAYEREVDAELDELKGTQESAAKKHKDALKDMHETSDELTKQMTEKTNAADADNKKGQEEYKAGGEKVKKLEKELQGLSDKQSAAQAELATVNSNLEFEVLNAQGCECDAVETVLAKHGHKHSRVHGKGKKGNLTKKKTSLLSAPDLKKVFKIEKTEAEIVDIMKDVQAEQSDYDTEVRAIQHDREAAERNHTHVVSSAGRDSDLLKKRASAQEDALKVLESMVSSKSKAVEAAESRAKDAKAQLDELTAELRRCGC